MSTAKMQEVLENLRGAAESDYTDKAGIVWGCVYLDNAIPKTMTRRSFSGVLSALEKAGLYNPCRSDSAHEGVFGYVRLES